MLRLACFFHALRDHGWACNTIYAEYGFPKLLYTNKKTLKTLTQQMAAVWKKLFPMSVCILAIVLGLQKCGATTTTEQTGEL